MTCEGITVAISPAEKLVVLRMEAPHGKALVATLSPAQVLELVTTLRDAVARIGSAWQAGRA